MSKFIVWRTAWQLGYQKQQIHFEDLNRVTVCEYIYEEQKDTVSLHVEIKRKESLVGVLDT